MTTGTIVRWVGCGLMMWLGGGCAHVASTTAILERSPDQDAAQPAPLLLKIERHVDTILNAPDIEEDQVLRLQIDRYAIGRRILIPSPNIQIEFTATRFGPASRGRQFTGYLVVNRVTTNEVSVQMKLDVTAGTADGDYTQTAKFHGTFRFARFGPDSNQAE